MNKFSFDPSRLIPGTKFEYDWTSKSIELFQRFIPKGITRILEIGTWEARTTCYFATHHLELAGGRILTVDPYSYAHARLYSGEIDYRTNAKNAKWSENNVAAVAKRGEENLKALEKFLREQSRKLKVIQDGYIWSERKPSHDALMGLAGPWNQHPYFDRFDLIFIDGSHLLADVTLDLFLAMKLVNIGKKDGTLIVVDDFPSSGGDIGFYPEAFTKEQAGVYNACLHFRKAFKPRLETIHFDAPAAIFKVVR